MYMLNDKDDTGFAALFEEADELRSSKSFAIILPAGHIVRHDKLVGTTKDLEFAN
jgi:hypothetical protein